MNPTDVFLRRVSVMVEFTFSYGLRIVEREKIYGVCQEEKCLFCSTLVLWHGSGSISIVRCVMNTGCTSPADVICKVWKQCTRVYWRNKWEAVYEKVLGTNGTTPTPIWYSADGSNYYPVEVSRVYQSGGYVYRLRLMVQSSIQVKCCNEPFNYCEAVW